MEYKVGMKLRWVRSVGGETSTEEVEVTRLLKRGHAKLSNGWAVDEDGFAEGSNRVPGGRVHSVTNSEKSQN